MLLRGQAIAKWNLATSNAGKAEYVGYVAAQCTDGTLLQPPDLRVQWD